MPMKSYSCKSTPNKAKLYYMLFPHPHGLIQALLLKKMCQIGLVVVVHDVVFVVSLQFASFIFSFFKNANVSHSCEKCVLRSHI